MVKSMEIICKQLSSLEKIRKGESGDHPQITEKTALAGERFSYQLYICTDDQAVFDLSVESQLAEHIRIYRVQDVIMDTPLVVPGPMEDYITHQPGQMPDVLVPLEKYRNKLYVDKVPCVLWVKVDVPVDAKPGSYPVSICMDVKRPGGAPVETRRCTMDLKVIDAVMPEQKLIYTRWMYLDCIATAHNVEIFSEAHWSLIEKYMIAARDLGINMLMVPVHTPPLDTEVGTVRPCVQLVDIEKQGDTYHFGFERFHRYIGLCKKHGIRYFEIAHMFFQWGAKNAPNIMVTENGETGYGFGWHTSSDSPEYQSFLRQYIPAIVSHLEAEGISENTYFHISDEPYMKDEEAYRTAKNMLRPLIGNCKTFDTVSEYEFYERGLIECPVTILSSIHDFLEHDVPHQWAYYCCGPTTVYPNIFMAMPSYRVRVLGFMMYKYGIEGFLHWGFNFYHTIRSLYPIDPYMTTSSDGAFPSGDPFIVYPGRDCVYPSIRGEVLYEGVQDMDICYALEALIGKEAVVKIIDETAGEPLRFDTYPKNNDFLLNLRQKLIETIAQNQ